MTYTVSITSQGQITIPVAIQRQLGLLKKQKALLEIQDGKLVIEPVIDFLELAGSLKNAKKVKASPSDMRAAFEEHLANEAMGKDE